jgi:aerobic carbon-monoxide dehydrogenase medium subunit
MKPSAFEYVRPGNLDETLQALSRYGDRGRILAGGQSLVPMMNMRLVAPEILIDVNRVAGLDRVRVEGPDLVIGAMARHAALRESAEVARHCPLMTEAYGHVAHGPIRNRGTLGGNVSHADPASEMPAVLLACDATLTCRSMAGERRIAARDFFLGPLQTALRTGEMLTEIRLPVAPGSRGYAFEEHSARHGDFAVVAVAVTLDVAGGKVSRAAVAVAGFGDHAMRAPAVEAAVAGTACDAGAIAAAAAAARDAARPVSSYHADEAYKRDLVETLCARALERALGRCR